MIFPQYKCERHRYMFVNNQELIYYSLLHQLLGFLPHLDVKLQRQTVTISTKIHLSLVKLFILFITEIISIIMYITRKLHFCFKCSCIRPIKSKKITFLNIFKKMFSTQESLTCRENKSRIYSLHICIMYFSLILYIVNKVKVCV
jgi:flagellar biosynthesis protein FlhB